jgi:Helix-turn-helix domain
MTTALPISDIALRDFVNKLPALPDPDTLLSEAQSAEFLGVTPRALQAWRQRGGGPSFVRISSRCVRYRRRDLIAWAEARLRTSTSEDGDAEKSAPLSD